MGKLKDIFKKNVYPNGIFDRCLNKFLDRKFNEKRGEKVEDENESFDIQISNIHLGGRQMDV